MLMWISIGFIFLSLCHSMLHIGPVKLGSNINSGLRAVTIIIRVSLIAVRFSYIAIIGKIIITHLF